MEGAADCFELESQELGKYGRVLGKLHINKFNFNFYFSFTNFEFRSCYKFL